MMLCVENLREYCRTCLVKLDKTKKDNPSKSIPINEFPELERLIQICLTKATVGGDRMCYYIPFLCCSCFKKWFDFSKLCQLAIKTDEKIRKVLERGLSKMENIDSVKYNENVDEYFINTESLVDIHELEKYETDFPFYTNDHSYNPFNNIQNKFVMDDPTQIKSRLKCNMNTMQLATEQNEDRISSYSDKADEINFAHESENKNVIQTNSAQKSKSTRKSLRVLAKTLKKRKSLLKTTKNHITDPGDNVAKKVRYQCEQCSKYFWEKNKYDGHMKQVHEGVKRPYKCQQCNKSYNLYKTLLQHKRECHNSEESREVFKCDRCDKIFKTRVILKQHLTNKHSEQKETMRSICDQCGFIAAHQYSLSRHIINKHTEPDQIKCDQCPKVFKTQYSLKYHVISNHNPSNIKPFKCSECQMGFTRQTLLNQHKRTHLKYTERIKCDFEGCQVRFVKRGDKAHHMRLVHLKIKQHVCDFCGDAFGAMQTLIHHRFIHTGEKPYKCNVCGQGFRQRTAMKTHRKTHFAKEPEEQDLINNLPEINLSLVNTLSS